jgi:hypothetical protein
MGKKHIDKNLIENKLANLYDRIDILQEPVQRVFEAIEALVDQPKETDNLELTQFKLELSILMKHFYNEMVDVHDRLIEDFEEIEDDLKKI